MPPSGMNKFVKIGMVGQGAFGKIVLCEEPGVGKVVLKKVPKSDDSYNEAKLLNELRHPNIVEARQTFRSEQSVYIVLEYLEGGDLDVLIRQRKEKPFKDKQTLSYCQQLTEALRLIHSHRVVHRDVKPVNLLLSADHKTLKLADFGISVKLAEGRSTLQGRVGTSAYMAPEILNGHDYDYKCDMWGLGCVLYELIERCKAFEGKTEMASQLKICNGTYRLPDESVFNPLLQALLSSDVSARPSAEEAIAALASLSINSSFLLFFNKSR